MAEQRMVPILSWQIVILVVISIGGIFWVELTPRLHDFFEIAEWLLLLMSDLKIDYGLRATIVDDAVFWPFGASHTIFLCFNWLLGQRQLQFSRVWRSALSNNSCCGIASDFDVTLNFHFYRRLAFSFYSLSFYNWGFNFVSELEFELFFNVFLISETHTWIIIQRLLIILKLGLFRRRAFFRIFTNSIPNFKPWFHLFNPLPPLGPETFQCLRRCFPIALYALNFGFDERAFNIIYFDFHFALLMG